MLTPEQISRLMPLLRLRSPAGRNIFGGFIQKRGGIVRHDAVAWGYARAADALGAHLLQNCEVTGFEMAGGAVSAVAVASGLFQ